MVGGAPVGCGRCVPCRVYRKRLWTSRQVLESYCHDENCFVTLTYEVEPPSKSVVPEHMRNYLKRLRKAVEPRRFRFYGVGEYGSENLRPHYHFSVFGLGYMDRVVIEEKWKGWRHDDGSVGGHCLVAEFNSQTAGYLCGYVVKDMVHRDDPRLNGLHPEFARRSNRPNGIGAPAMAVIAEQLHSDAGLDEIEKIGDVPSFLLIGKRKVPLGRYLKRKLRDEVGMPEWMRQQVIQRWLDETSSEVHSLLNSQIAADSKAAVTSASVVVKRDQGRIWSVVAKDKLKHARKL